jgi:hypothetical protein
VKLNSQKKPKFKRTKRINLGEQKTTNKRTVKTFQRKQ